MQGDSTSPGRGFTARAVKRQHTVFCREIVAAAAGVQLNPQPVGAAGQQAVRRHPQQHQHRERRHGEGQVRRLVHRPDGGRRVKVVLRNATVGQRRKEEVSNAPKLLFKHLNSFKWVSTPPLGCYGQAIVFPDSALRRPSFLTARYNRKATAYVWAVVVAAERIPVLASPLTTAMTTGRGAASSMTAPG